MKEFGIKSKNGNLAQIGLENVRKAYWNASVPEFVNFMLLLRLGKPIQELLLVMILNSRTPISSTSSKFFLVLRLVFL